MADCIFCSIAAGDVPAEIVADNDQGVAFNDQNPKAPVHVLVVPRRHIASAAEIHPEDGAMLGGLFALVNEVAQGLVDGWRLVTNVGADGGQSVEHLHFHILGGRQLSWPPG